MVEGVFFDFDGTLFDTERDILEAYRKVFRKLNISADLKFLRIGPPLEESIRAVRPDISGGELAEAMAGFREFYDGSGFPATPPYPGVPEMLRRLARSGKKLFIATNKRVRPTRLILEKHGFLPLFAGVYAGDSDPACRRSKSENLLYAVSQHGLKPENSVMIGDTRLDIEAGRRAGMRTFGVTWGYDVQGELEQSRPDGLAASPEELLNWLEAR